MQVNKLSAIAILISLFGVAHAAKTTTLTVGATLQSPACAIDISNGGYADFGNISRSLLSATTSTAIGSKEMSVTITCTASTLTLLKVTDNAAASSPAEGMIVVVSGAPSTVITASQLLGLGRTTTDKPIGGYALVFKRPVVDGILSPYIFSNGNGSAYGGTSALFNSSVSSLSYHRLYSSHFFGTTGRPTNGIADMPGQTTVYPITVAASLSESGNFNTGQDVDLAGSATLEVIYL